MSDIVMHMGLRLPRPVEVDWLKRLSERRIKALMPGKFVWLIVGNHLQCAEITKATQRFEGKHTSDKGFHVFYKYSFHDGRRHECHHMKLIRDSETIDLFRIADLCEANEYYVGLVSEPDLSKVVELKQARGGGG